MGIKTSIRFAKDFFLYLGLLKTQSGVCQTLNKQAVLQVCPQKWENDDSFHAGFRGKCGEMKPQKSGNAEIQGVSILSVVFWEAINGRNGQSKFNFKVALKS